MKTGRALLVLAGILVLAGTLLPLWGMTMIAPQYPDGLHVRVYPGQIHGDLSIINVLNHYVGMRSLEMENFAQVLYLPYVLATIGTGLIVAGLFSKRGIAMAMVVLLLITAVGGFFELRRNLIAYGTNLDPAAPLDMEPFVPPIIGHYVVWNFDIQHSFMAGAYVLFLATALAFVGWRRLGGWTPQRSRVVGLFIVSALIAIFFTFGMSAEAATAASASPSSPTSKSASSESSFGSAAPMEIVVAPTGSPTLTQALAAIADGGTVRVRAGVYQGPILVERGVTLIADDAYTKERDVRTDGGNRYGAASAGRDGAGVVEIVGEGDVVTVTGDARLIGVTVRHVGTLVRSDEAAVRLFGHGATIRDNTIVFDTAHGIYIERGGHHVIRDNTIVGLRPRAIDDRGNGMFLFDTKNNHIEENRIEHARDGIYLSFAGMDTIVNNEISFSRYGIHSMFSSNILYKSNLIYKNVVGSAFMYSENMDLLGNIIVDHSDHRGYGILLKDANRNRLFNNYVVGNNLGLFFDLSDGNDIAHNIFAANGLAIELFSSSARNEITANAFLGNRADTLLHVGRHSTVWWTEQAGGNYWDTYRGVDIDGHGFGALPHTSGDPFGFLTRNHPELAAFYLGPAIEALAWAEQAFPLFRTPRVTDERPAVQPDRAALADMRSRLALLARSSDEEEVPEVKLLGAIGLFVSGVMLFGPLFRRTETEGPKATRG